MRQNRLQISVSFQVREILSPKIGGGVERRGRGCTKWGAAWSAGGMVAHWGGVERRGHGRALGRRGAPGAQLAQDFHFSGL